MAEQIDVLFLAPGKDLEAVTIGNDLRSLQRTIGGGYIESVPIHETTNAVYMIGDEEARFKPEMLANFFHRDFGYAIIGPVFFTKGDGEGEFVSLDATDVAEVKAWLAHGERVTP